MSDQVIDKLIFALGGDVKSLNEAYAEAEKGAAKTGTAIQQNLGKGFQDAAGQASQHSAAIKQALGGVESSSKKIGENIQVSRRELVYFIREMASGDLQRAPATIALLLSHMLELSPVAIAAGAAMAALPIAITVAAVKADNALAKLRTSMALTGNASGIGLSAATTMAAAAAGQGNLSIMGAQKIMGGLIGANVPGASLGLATATAGNYALGAGVSQDKATDMIARIFEDPAKAAQELNQQYRLLSVEQTEQVKNLAAQGDLQHAGDIVLEAFNARTREAADAASFFSKSLSAAGNFFGNMGHNIAVAVGGGSAQEKLNSMQQANQLYPGRYSTADMKPLQDQVAKENAAAKAAGVVANQNQEMHLGWADAQKGADEFNQHLQDLKNTMVLDSKAAADAGLQHDKNTKTYLDTADAAEKVYDATKKYGSPEAEAQRRLANARQLAGTPIDQQGVVAARQQAQETYYKNLQDPRTANQADDIRKLDMAAANYNRSDANKSAEQQKNLQVMKDQAVAARQVADAYGVSDAAAERAKVEGEVDVEVTNRQIAAKDKLAAVTAKMATAYATAAEAVAKEVNALKLSNAGLTSEVSAGGNPYLIAAARRQSEADVATHGLSPEDAAKQRPGLLQQYATRDQSQGYLGLNATQYSAGQNLGNLQQTYGAVAGGASQDYLRHLKVEQDALEEVNKVLAPSDPLYKTYLDNLTKTNIAVSDASEALAKIQKEASGLAGDVTGGLGSFLANPGKTSPLDALAGIGQNMLNTLVQTNILEPMNKSLTSMFSGMLGGNSPLALGSTPANAMWVQMSPLAGGVPGGSSGGGIGGFFSNLFGGSSDGLDPVKVTPQVGTGGGIGDFLSSAFSDFAGLFDSGGSIAPGQWGVKSGKPEIIQGGTAGVSILPLDAPQVRAAIGSQRSSYGGAGGSSVQRGGDSYHFHLPGVTDTQSFVRSKSQIAASVTSASQQGRRNM